MKNQELKDRTKHFALRVIRLTDVLRRKMAADVLGRQVLRSATAVAANYRSACRARSRADFVSKMGIVEEDADEAGLWLEIIGESGLPPERKLSELHRDASELTTMAVASIRTARSRPATPQPAFRSPQ